jgi:dienelactone hydrolase
VKRATALMCTLLVTAVAASGCGRGVPSAAVEVPYEEPGKILADNDLPAVGEWWQSAVSLAKRIKYTSRSAINDNTTHVTGAVFVPKGQPPPTGWPIVAFGHATTGTLSDCAPSLSPTLLNTSAIVEKLVAAGYIVALPDYQGLGNLGTDNTYYPYLDSTTLGYNVIDSVRAARNVVPDASDRWVALGTSEGGQAAWAANELMDNYGWGLKLLGAASLSPISDVTKLADAAAAGELTKDQRVAMQGFLTALENEYGDDINLNDYRRGIAKEKADVLSACQGPALQERTKVVDQITADDLRPSTPMATEALRRYLQKTSLPQGPTQAPMLVIYGGQDSLIPAAWTTRALESACRLGDVIQIQMQPELGHNQIDPSTALDWVGERFNDLPMPNSCQSATVAPDPSR